MEGKYYEGCKPPESKKATCQVCFMCDHMGTYFGTDLDPEFHKGFTIGRGKKMYWYLIWHGSGNCTVYSDEEAGRMSGRYIKGDQEITIHFK
jgi:hypothetical protein